MKHTNFLRRNSFLIFGLYFLVTTLFFVFSYEGVEKLFALGYGIMGAGYLYIHFNKQGRSTEFISWDEEKIVVSEFQQAPITYFWSEVDQINFSENHLTIKSGAANGIMIDLKGYKTEDLQVLKNALNQL